MTPETFALALAGIVLPFVQEKLAGAKISGTLALVTNLLACLVIAAAATLLSSEPLDTGTLLAKVGGVFILAQLVFERAVKPTAPALA